jgi:hypothetical protein
MNLLPGNRQKMIKKIFVSETQLVVMMGFLNVPIEINTAKRPEVTVVMIAGV